MSKRRDLKLVWLSNAPHTNSGYATFTRDLLFRLLKDGWDVTCIANYGVSGFDLVLHGEDLIDERFKDLKLKIYPHMDEAYGTDALFNHSKVINPHVAFAMLDLQTLNPQLLAQLAQSGVRFIPYLPIDQDPPHPAILNNLNIADRIITFSKYGQEVLQNRGYTSNLIVEGIDTQIFKPMDKQECRKEMQIPQDAFVFGMIGANKENPPRKGYQEALEAFKVFVEKHPEARIFFHTQQMHPGGFPILDYARYLGIADKTLFLNPYKGTFGAESHQIAKEINCFDVLLHPSQTEGFGLLSIEAQACGVPVIVNNCHSQPELVIEGQTGEIANVGKGFFRNLLAYVYPVDVNSLYEKMENLYLKVKNEKLKKKIANKAREHIINNYNIDTLIKERWIPYLESLQDEILPVK